MLIQLLMVSRSPLRVDNCALLPKCDSHGYAMLLLRLNFHNSDYFMQFDVPISTTNLVLTAFLRKH
jgi:hypothetical protein